MPKHTPAERKKRSNKGGATRGRTRARSVASPKARVPSGTGGTHRPRTPKPRSAGSPLHRSTKPRARKPKTRTKPATRKARKRP